LTSELQVPGMLRHKLILLACLVATVCIGWSLGELLIRSVSSGGIEREGKIEVDQKRYHRHRQRPRERFLKHGLEPFADYEAVELLLMLAIPRLDFKSHPRPGTDDRRLEGYYQQLCIYAHILEQRDGKRLGRLLLYWTGEPWRADALMVFPCRPEVTAPAAKTPGRRP